MSEFRKIRLIDEKDEDEDEDEDEEEEDEDEEEEEEEEDNFDDSLRTTSTSQGARPKFKTKNYDQILSDQNRESVKYFPKMKDDIIVYHSKDGKIQIGMHGSYERIDFFKSDGKINSFRGELKKALGPSSEKLEREYFIELKRTFPNIDDFFFELILAEDGRFRIRTRGSKRDGVFLFKKDGELRGKIDVNLKKFLGPLAEEILDKNEIENELNRSRIKEIDEELKDKKTTDDKIETLNNERNELEERNDEREKTIENIEEQMKLKDHIKRIFKKYGLSITSVTSAIVTVISAIVSNLRIGLKKFANDLGNGLKEIGKKLATILPGMVGAIASFIFKTAGEVIGFLSKNVWLLIIAIVVAAVDRFKKKNK